MVILHLKSSGYLLKLKLFDFEKVKCTEIGATFELEFFLRLTAFFVKQIYVF